MLTQCSRTAAQEQAGYFEVPGAHLYTVLHQVAEPTARVLLVGPFAAERHFSYHAWVRWARYLAARGIEALRFDYRGIGESTGAFEEMNFETWREDVQILAEWMASRSPRLPFILHGLEFGSILAGGSFHAGIGDGLLLWAPPGNANQVLRTNLIRWAGLEQIWESTENRRTASEYIRSLEQGSTIEVHGYQWSSRLWRTSFHFDLPAPLVEESSAADAYGRPVKISRFGNTPASLALPYSRFDNAKDLTWLYSENFDWLADKFDLATGEAR